MAQIHNSDLFKELKDGGKIQQLRDNIPNQLAEKVVPVMEVNPKLLRRCEVVSSYASTAGAGAANIYSVPAGKTFYLCSLTLGLMKDAACDTATGKLAVTGTTNGVSSIIASIPYLTLTATAQTITLNFPFPLKIDEGTNITSSSFAVTAGTVSRSSSVIGYLQENIRA